MHTAMRRALRELPLVLAAGVLAGLLNNAFSPRSIPLVGDWRKAYGVPSAGGQHSPTYGNVEIGLSEAERLRAGGALFLDARPTGEYAAGHIPGAASFPFEESADRIADVLALCEGRARTVVYCAGLECDEAHLLARALRQAGTDRVAVFAGGIDEWTARGLPVTKGATP